MLWIKFVDIVFFEFVIVVGVCNVIIISLEIIDIDEEILKKLVGCNFDGVIVMMGKKLGVVV